MREGGTLVGMAKQQQVLENVHALESSDDSSLIAEVLADAEASDSPVDYWSEASGKAGRILTPMRFSGLLYPLRGQSRRADRISAQDL